jgi:hypothetical protein
MATNGKKGDGKKPQEENKGSKSIPGALGKKAVEFAKENPSVAAAGVAFFLVGGWIPTAAAAALASKPVRDKIGGLVPTEAKDAIKGAAGTAFEQVGNLKKGLEETLGQGAPEASADEEEKPATPKKGNGGRKGPKGLGPNPNK